MVSVVQHATLPAMNARHILIELHGCPSDLLDKRALGELLGAEHFTLLEILVTSAKCRGRGVGAGMVKEIMSKLSVRSVTFQG